MTFGLTPRQARLLDFIREFKAENKGSAPTINEMMLALGTRSRGNVHWLLSRLEERGAIRRLPRRARAIEVTGDAP